MGCHTDSPCLRIAPISKLTSCDFAQLAIQTYGGGLWHTWFDRTLSIAGRVIVKNDGKLEDRLIHHKEPILQIPNLAIHITDDARGTFKWDNET